MRQTRILDTSQIPTVQDSENEVIDVKEVCCMRERKSEKLTFDMRFQVQRHNDIARDEVGSYPSVFRNTFISRSHAQITASSPLFDL